MFTFGIFTTHLPYLAFVFFYVFFLFVGIPKASSGELSGKEEKIYTVTEVVQDYAFPAKETDPGQPGITFSLRRLTDFELTPGEKIRFRTFYSSTRRNGKFCYARFSRPPPLT